MDDLTPTRITERLAERWHGETSPDGATEIAQWIEENPAHAERVRGLQRVWGAHRLLEVAVDVQAALRHIHARVHATYPQADGTSPSTSRGTPRTSRAAVLRTAWREHPMWTVASAAVGAVVLVGTLLFSHGRATRGADTPVATYVTARGERARIELGDGTSVVLDVASRLVVPKRFTDGNRTLYLTGEAYFRVAHVAGAPFTVVTGDTRTRVLGTEFAVRAYRPTDVTVAVRTGRVAVGRTVLVARDVAEISPRELRVRHAQDQAVDAMLGFAEGRLVFTDVPLRDVITDLDRWYDVDVRLGDPALGNRHISATLLSGSVRDLTDNLQAIFDVRTVRNGRTVTLYPREAN